MDSDNLLSEIMNNVRFSMNIKSNSQQGYIETTNYVIGKEKKIETSISIFEIIFNLMKFLFLYFFAQIFF